MTDSPLSPEKPSIPIGILACRVCGDCACSPRWRAREMMIGTRDEFVYFECSKCGCLQIEEIPSNLSRYYENGYYSNEAKSWIKQIALDRRTAYLAGSPSLIGWLISLVQAPNTDPAIAPVDVTTTDQLLEVGCGNGIRLRKMFEAGFRNLHGIDPFMSKRSQRNWPYKLERRSLSTLAADGAKYDVVFFDHSFEHIPDQLATLLEVRALLRTGGRCILRIPFASSYAWEHYRTDWVQLDAPRHLYLHSRRSLEILCSKAGLKILRLFCDSYSLQFWGSEQYKQDIPLRSARSWHVNGHASLFTSAQIAEFDRLAADLNAEGRGDQITLVLRPEAE